MTAGPSRRHGRRAWRDLAATPLAEAPAGRWSWSSPDLLALGGAALAYLALAEFGLLWRTHDGGASPVWPAAGAGLLAVLWLGPPGAVAVFAGCLAALAGSGSGLGVEATLSAGAALSALLSAGLMRRWLRRPWDIAESDDLARFLAVVAIGAGVVATVGALGLGWGQSGGWDAGLAVWRNWWAGDAAGTLAVTLLVVWTRAERGRLRAAAARPDSLAKGVLVLVALGAGLWLNLRLDLFFFVIPGLVLATVLFQRLGAAWAGFATAAGTLVAGVAGPGSLLIAPQLFVLTMLATVGLLATALGERDLSEALRAAEAEAQAAARRAVEAEGRLRQALVGAEAGIWRVRLEPRSLWGDQGWRELHGLGSDEPVTEAVWRARVHPDDLPRVDAAVRDALEGTTTAWVQDVRVLHPGRGERWLHKRAQVERDAGGRPQAYGGLVFDVTERKRAEAQVELLLREVNHRSKNLLAVVQAVARQTARSDPASFADRFFERLSALSASHDLLVRSEWRRIDLEELVRLQLAHFADLVGGRVEMSGPTLHLNAAAAQAIGMALHELATNAGKYGALSNATGRVGIGWEVAGAGAAARVRLRWSESGGPTVAPSGRTGFGTTVMVRMAEAALDGTVRLERAPGGVVWELEAPASRVLEDATN